MNKFLLLLILSAGVLLLSFENKDNKCMLPKKDGIYKTLDEFLKNEPSIRLIHRTKKKVVKTNSKYMFYYTYHFNLSAKDQMAYFKQIGDVYGICQGGEFYRSFEIPSEAAAWTSNNQTHTFFKTESLCDYHYFESLVKINNEDNYYYTLIHHLTGVETRYERQELTKVFEDAPNLCKRYKNELKNYAKIKKYILEYYKLKDLCLEEVAD